MISIKTIEKYDDCGRQFRIVICFRDLGRLRAFVNSTRATGEWVRSKTEVMLMRATVFWFMMMVVLVIFMSNWWWWWWWWTNIFIDEDGDSDDDVGGDYYDIISDAVDSDFFIDDDDNNDIGKENLSVKLHGFLYAWWILSDNILFHRRLIICTIDTFDIKL